MVAKELVLPGGFKLCGLVLSNSRADENLGEEHTSVRVLCEIEGDDIRGTFVFEELIVDLGHPGFGHEMKASFALKARELILNELRDDFSQILDVDRTILLRVLKRDFHSSIANLF